MGQGTDPVRPAAEGPAPSKRKQAGRKPIPTRPSVRAVPAAQVVAATPTEPVGPTERRPPARPPAGAEETEPEAIRADIARTRAEMSNTIDAIQERLDPERLVEQAKDAAKDAAQTAVQDTKEAVREATIGRAEQMVSDVSETARGARSSIMDTIRDNPIPATLAAVGLGWLFLSGRNRSTSGRLPSRTGQYPAVAYGSPPPPPRAAVDQVAGSAREAVANAADRAQDAVGQGASAAQDLASQAQDQVAAVADQAQARAQAAQGQLQQLLMDNPLAVGAVALGVGAAVGLAMPGTPKENQLLGQARDRLLDQAQAVVQDTQQKVQRVAEQAQRAAKEEASRQQLDQ